MKKDDKMKNNFFKNVVSGFAGQLIVIALGLIIPRIMIKSYGSDVNGFLSTITQIFSYLALFEAGIGQATRNALYKPVVTHNIGEINKVLSTSKAYFRQVTIYYAIAVILIALLAPFIIVTDISPIIVICVIIFEGLSGVISFYYIETSIILLNSDGRGYINNFINLTNKILAYIVKIVMACLGINIAILQFVYFLITIIKVIVYQVYIQKEYPWLSYSKKHDSGILSDRNSYLLTEIAWTIFSSTDMIVLSIFVSTKVSSVYAIYNMVFISLNVLLNAVANSVSYLLGQSYHEDINRYEKMHDSLTLAYLGSMTIIMSVCYILTIPFVKLYTSGVNDVNYIVHTMPLLFCIIQLLSWSRNVSGNLTGIAGYAKPTSYISLVEAFLNLTFSVIFVYKFGIVGVLFATVVSLPLKVLWCIYISDKKVLKRSYLNSVKIIGVNYALFVIIALISNVINIDINSFLSLIVYGAALTVTISIYVIGCNYVINKKQCLYLVKFIIER